MSIIGQLIEELEAAGYVMRGGGICNRSGAPTAAANVLGDILYDRWRDKEKAAKERARAASTPWTWHEGPDGTKVGFWNGYSATVRRDGSSILGCPNDSTITLFASESAEAWALNHWEAAK